jgi:hypothetical protein
LKLIIRYTIPFLVVFCSLNSADSQEFLNKYISIPLKELSVEQYLRYIENTTGYVLTYSDTIIKEKKIALDEDSLKLKDLLDTLFSNIPIQYIMKGNLLILSPQPVSITQTEKIKVSGIIRNSRNEDPVSYAAVFVPNESIGTLANADGAFEMYLPSNRPIDTLMVSCIGYTQKLILASQFLAGPVAVSLQPDKYLLDEVIVRPLKPLELLIGALNNKSDNYGTKPFLITAFFREATRQDDKYISLSEAIIDILKNPYTSYDTEDLVRLKKGRKGTNTEHSELVNLIVEGGLYNNMLLDIMKYGVNFLEPENFYRYNYVVEKEINYNNRQTYILDFTFKNNSPETGYDGKIYLDAATLAVTRAEFEISPAGIDYAKNDIVKKTPPGFRVKPKYGRYEVDYRLYDGKWHLMHARSEVSVKVKKERGEKNKGFTCGFVTTSEFVVTGTVTDNFEKIKYREASKPNDILYQQIGGTDLEFWGNENIILPDEPLQETIDKLINDNKNKNSVLSTQPLKN